MLLRIKDICAGKCRMEVNSLTVALIIMSLQHLMQIGSRSAIVDNIDTSHELMVRTTAIVQQIGSKRQKRRTNRQALVDFVREFCRNYKQVIEVTKRCTI